MFDLVAPGVSPNVEGARPAAGNGELEKGIQGFFNALVDSATGPRGKMPGSKAGKMPAATTFLQLANTFYLAIFHAPLPENPQRKSSKIYGISKRS